MYKYFSKPILFLFYSALRSNGDYSVIDEATIDLSKSKDEIDPLDIDKNTLTKCLRTKFFPIRPQVSDQRPNWSKYVKIWLYKSWELKLNNGENKSEDKKKDDILAEFRELFGHLTGGEAPGKPAIVRNYNRYKNKK